MQQMTFKLLNRAQLKNADLKLDNTGFRLNTTK